MMSDIDQAALDAEYREIGELVCALIECENVAAVKIEGHVCWPRWVTISYVKPSTPLYEEGEKQSVLFITRAGLAGSLRALLEQEDG